MNKCEQIDGRFDGEESFESAIMINAIATEGDSGTYVPAENVFINLNITFSYDEIVHYNSKLIMNKFTNILVSGMSLFSTRYDYETVPDQKFSYKIVNGNMTIYCEELIFGNGSAQLVSTTFRTTMINDTFYVISSAYGSFTFFNLPLKAYKGYVFISEADVDYNGFIYKNISSNLTFNSFSFTLNSKMNFKNATYFVDYSNFSSKITGTYFSFENAQFNANII